MAINRTKVDEVIQIQPGEDSTILTTKEGAPTWATPTDAGIATLERLQQALDTKQDNLTEAELVAVNAGLTANEVVKMKVSPTVEYIPAHREAPSNEPNTLVFDFTNRQMIITDPDGRKMIFGANDEA